jgi:hypothetical protein
VFRAARLLFVPHVGLSINFQSVFLARCEGKLMPIANFGGLYDKSFHDACDKSSRDNDEFAHD